MEINHFTIITAGAIAIEISCYGTIAVFNSSFHLMERTVFKSRFE
jgi:hypothetical protein